MKFDFSKGHLDDLEATIAGDWCSPVPWSRMLSHLKEESGLQLYDDSFERWALGVWGIRFLHESSMYPNHLTGLELDESTLYATAKVFAMIINFEARSFSYSNGDVVISDRAASVHYWAGVLIELRRGSPIGDFEPANNFHIWAKEHLGITCLIHDVLDRDCAVVQSATYGLEMSDEMLTMLLLKYPA